jgi:Fe2+ transport system protein FeoA
MSKYPIPRDTNVKNKPLSHFAPGERGRIVAITLKDPALLHRLTGLGLYPGALVTLRQHRPTAIVRVAETDVALENKLTQHIECQLLEEK